MKKVKNSIGEKPAIGIVGLGYVGLPLALEFFKKSIKQLGLILTRIE